MKSIDQFDYPSKLSQSYKAGRGLDNSSNNIDSKKVQYKENMQYHMQMERNKVKQQEKLKKQQQAKKKKATIQSQLQRKRKQLQQLQALKQQAQENQKKAYEMAILKEQQDRLKKEENQRKKRQFDQNAVNRFSEAIERLREERQAISFKERLAEQRRKTANDFQKLERNQAKKYQSLIEQKEKQSLKKESQIQEYKKTVNTFVSVGHADYNRTCMHNLKIVKEKEDVQDTAFERGRHLEDKVVEKSIQKKQRQLQNERRSKERSREAMLKIQRQRQYQQFQKDTEEEQKRYNLERIQAGKRNQFIGVKPNTLAQMQESKKMRSEEEFNKMFFARPTSLIEGYNNTASEYEIIQRRIPQKGKQTMEKLPKRSKNSYLRQRQETQVPEVSEGKYSFQEQAYSQFKNQSRSESHINQSGKKQEHHQENEQDNEECEEPRGYPTKNSLKETRIPDDYRNKASGEKFNKSKDGFKIEETDKMQSKKSNDKGNKPQAQSHDTFNTDEMLKKYGLKRDSPQKNKARELVKKVQNKRKVIESNVCQNRPHEKEELNYSSQSEEDSQM